MKTFTANEAKTRFGEFIDLAQREPVRVTRRDRVVGVLVSAQDHESSPCARTLPIGWLTPWTLPPVRPWRPV